MTVLSPVEKKWASTRSRRSGAGWGNPPIDTAGTGPRQPHYWTQYGFVYAGAALPASQTAINASTILQNLVRPGGRANPPKFKEIGSFMWRLARRFMQDRISFGADGLFQAAVFGWCPYESRYKIAFIDGPHQRSKGPHQPLR